MTLDKSVRPSSEGTEVFEEPLETMKIPSLAEIDVASPEQARAMLREYARWVGNYSAVLPAIIAKASEVVGADPATKPEVAASTEQSGPQFLTLTEAARRAGRSPQTLYNWKTVRKLTGETGLVRFAGKPMIDWKLFLKSFGE